MWPSGEAFGDQQEKISTNVFFFFFFLFAWNVQ
jgi:hypothetical protein